MSENGSYTSLYLQNVIFLVNMDLLASNTDLYLTVTNHCLMGRLTYMNHFNGMLIDFSHWGQPLKMMSRAAPRLLETQLDVGQGLVHFVSQTWLREKPWGIHGAFWLFGDAKYPRLCCVNKVKENLENRVSMKCVSLGDT